MRAAAKILFIFVPICYNLKYEQPFFTPAGSYYAGVSFILTFSARNFHMKKCAAGLAALFLIVIFLSPRAFAAGYELPEGTSITAQSAYFVNLDTGIVVFEQNADEQRSVASLTKLMTALLLMENVSDLENTKITAERSLYVPPITNPDSSTADIWPGETVSALNMLYAMMLPSANEAAEALIAPGVRMCDLDRAARDVIEDAGYGKYFTHRLGHSIGLQDHEPGDVSLANEQVVEPGMTFSIEPGIYLPGRTGVRIEDLALVTESGVEILNAYPHDPVRLD